MPCYTLFPFQHFIRLQAAQDSGTCLLSQDWSSVQLTWLVLFSCVRRNFRITQTQAFTQVGNKWKLFLWTVLDHGWLLSCNIKCITWHSKNTCERTVQFQWGKKTALTSNSSFTGRKNRYTFRFVTNSWSTLTGCDLQSLYAQQIYIRFAQCFET